MPGAPATATELPAMVPRQQARNAQYAIDLTVLYRFEFLAEHSNEQLWWSKVLRGHSTICNG
jgi:hypothetical protein